MTRERDDNGSTLPLIIGFFMIAMLVVAGGVAAGDAFVQQRGLQEVCDGAALAAAATAADLDRGSGVTSGGGLKFADVAGAVRTYLARDPSRADVHVDIALAPDRRTLALTCSETRTVTFGVLFGKGGGVQHVVHSAARAPISR